MSRHILVPSFQVFRCVRFACLSCGAPIEIQQAGKHHISSGERCPACHAYYVTDWHRELERSTIVLVKDAESEEEAS